MTTRSGALYKRVELAELETAMNTPESGTATEPGGSGIPELVRLLLEDRRKRDDELAEEKAR